MRILYLDLDALRPDHLGCYGYHRNTSPNIDSIATQGVRFERYYTSDAPCLPSRTAMMTGKFGIHNGVINHGGTAADLRIEGESRDFQSTLNKNSLPGFLHTDLGLHTCYIGGFGSRHSAWSFYAGFKEIHDTGMDGMESAEDVTPSVLDWIESKGQDDNWYLHVNYWDPHTPYRAPEHFGNPFEKDSLPSWYNQDVIDRHMMVPGPHTIQDISMYDDATYSQWPRQPGHVTNMEEMKTLIDGYDCSIRYMDDHIGKLMKALEEKGILDDTIIIISSDHGENFGELGIYSEHSTADDICNKVPMIIRWPGKIKAGHVDYGFHYTVDFSPTLAELFDKEPRSSWDGKSYAPSLISGKDTGRQELIFGQCAHGCQRSVRWQDWIYIKTWNDGYHCFEEEMLFDLKSDPHEQINVIEKFPDIAEAARQKYNSWHDDMMRSMPFHYTDDPLLTVLREKPFHTKHDMKVYSKRLMATGRGDSLKIIRERHRDVKFD